MRITEVQYKYNRHLRMLVNLQQNVRDVTLINKLHDWARHANCMTAAIIRNRHSQWSSILLGGIEYSAFAFVLIMAMRQGSILSSVLLNKHI